MNEEKTSPQKADGMGISRGEDALAGAAPAQQSWGEKYGAKTLDFTRNWIINYFINFTIGAVFAYKFDTSKTGAKAQNWLNKVSGLTKLGLNPKTASEQFEEAKKLGNTKLAKEIGGALRRRWAYNLATRNQFLLMGGHVLLPFLKIMKDHEKELTLWTQHKVDQWQEFTGNGNDASKRSLAEYKHIQTLLDAGRHGDMKEADLSKDDQSLLEKHHINTNFHFEEHKESWLRVLKARLIGMTFSTAASGGLGWLSGQKFIPALQYKRVLETPFGKWAADNIITKVPGLRTFFAQQPELIGEYFIADAILTTVSAGVYRAVEAADEKKDAEQRAQKKEKKAEAAAQPKVSQVQRDGAIAARDMALNNT